MSSSIPLSRWVQDNSGESLNSWYYRLRPENERQQLIDAGVIAFVFGRWRIFPDKWSEFCANNHMPQVSGVIRFTAN
jgi:hypothetical protein